MLLLYDALMISLALEDVKVRKIRNEYVAGIFVLSVISVFVMREVSVFSRIAGMFAVSVPMYACYCLKPGSFGGGDMKLTFACGAFLGLKLLMKGTVIAIFLAAGYCIYLMCTKKKWKNIQFALGPFLSAGYVVSTFWLI